MTNNSWAIHKRVTLRHNDGGLQIQNISMCRTPPNLTSQGETLVRGIARHRLGVFVQSSDNMIGSCLAELSGFMPMSWSHWSCQHCHGFYIAKKNVWLVEYHIGLWDWYSHIFSIEIYLRYMVFNVRNCNFSPPNISRGYFTFRERQNNSFWRDITKGGGEGWGMWEVTKVVTQRRKANRRWWQVRSRWFTLTISAVLWQHIWPK